MFTRVERLYVIFNYRPIESRVLYAHLSVGEGVGRGERGSFAPRSYYRIRVFVWVG